MKQLIPHDFIANPPKCLPDISIKQIHIKTNTNFLILLILCNLLLIHAHNLGPMKDNMLQKLFVKHIMLNSIDHVIRLSYLRILCESLTHFKNDFLRNYCPGWNLLT